MISFQKYIIKSPRYTRGDYVFVPVLTLPPLPPAADVSPRDNFYNFFIYFILGTIVGPDL